MQTPLHRELISPREMQQILSIGRTKCYEILASGEVEVVKIGRLLRVKKSSLDRWLKDQSY